MVYILWIHTNDPNPWKSFLDMGPSSVNGTNIYRSFIKDCFLTIFYCSFFISSKRFYYFSSWWSQYFGTISRKRTKFFIVAGGGTLIGLVLGFCCSFVFRGMTIFQWLFGRNLFSYVQLFNFWTVIHFHNLLCIIFGGWNAWS